MDRTGRETATSILAEYGNAHWDNAMRGVEPKTPDPYRAVWRSRVVKSLGHLPITMVTTGVVDRAVTKWIEAGCGESTIKNTLAALAQVLNQAVGDEVIDRNRVDVTGWQRQLVKYEDEIDDPRSLAPPNWEALQQLADALVEASHGHYRGWGDAVVFAACTAPRIGEVSGCRVGDIDTEQWVRTLRRQTTPGPGGMKDKRTKGKRSRLGPQGGRIATAVLRDTTNWDRVVARLGFEHLRRHDLRHTGLTCSPMPVSRYTGCSGSPATPIRASLSVTCIPISRLSGMTVRSCLSTRRAALAPNWPRIARQRKIPSDRGQRGFSVCRADRI
ncbi:site-specific integrase [Nocardia spumae]|uniref:site-specific integrase n=1 Tax=Nocardia spumae TaxID=2887190 RepID=UPI001D15A2A6|nr:site-specific integrase [Nocardia spumae]